MKPSHTRFLPAFLTCITVILAGFTGLSVQKLIEIDARTINDTAISNLRGTLQVEPNIAALRESYTDLARVAALARQEREAAGGWATTLGVAFFVCLGLLVLSLVAAERSLRDLLRMARSARSDADRTKAQLVEAVENINEGFVLYDNDDRLIVCNRKFREAYKIVGDLLKPGVTSEEILRAATQRGQFPQAGDRIEEWVANRMAQRRRFDPPFEQQLAGGRWHMVSDRATRDGGLVGIRTDITELKRREFELREARQRLEDQADRMRLLAEETQQAKVVLQDAIESINEGFCLYDASDRLVMCNSRFLDLHDRIRDQITPGVSFSDLTRAAIGSGAMIVADSIDAAIEGRVKMRQNLEDASLEEQFDEDRWIRISTRRMRNGGIVSVFADITEMKQREFALTSAHGRLERQAQEMSNLADAAHRANRAKSEFLAMMSHEIRTPLNGVISALHLVRDSNLQQDDRHLIKTARAGAHSLLTILNDILDMSKIEAGMLTLESSAFRIHDLVDTVTALGRVQAQSKNLDFEVNIDAELPEFVSGDIDRIRQMALNYVSNAIKFTNAGSVEVQVSRIASSRDLVRFEVVDTGIGIPHEKHGHVFRDFTQLDQSIRRRHGGTGLGLAITRRLARIMGGQVGFTSDLGHGSNFWFEIPLPSCRAPLVEEKSDGSVREMSESATIAANGMRVLLAEDNETNRYLARLMLERMGCVVAEVCDGEQAVDAASKGIYDLVLMDISMPTMDGLEATRQIRRTGFKAPIIALSANTGADFEGECRDAGMDGYLSKPIDVKALRQRLGIVAGVAMDARESPSLAQIDDTGFLELHALDRVHADLGPLEFQRIFESCRNDIGNELSVLLAAWANLPDTASADAMRRAAHKLVSLSATIGASELSRLSRLIESGCWIDTDRDSFETVARSSIQMLTQRANQLESIDDHESGATRAA